MQKLPVNSVEQEKFPCVVITRPLRQAHAFAGILRRNGIDSINVPLLDIVSFHENNPDDAQWVRQIKNRILDLDNYQKIIFVSQNAVEHGMQWIDDYWPQLPTGIEFFAIGETTANLLSGYGVAVENIATSKEGDMTSEVLLRHPALQSVVDEKILILRGVGGRGHLADILRERGARVDYCEVYQRRIPADAQSKLLQWINNCHATDRYLLVFHSGETWNYFCELLQKIQAAGKDDLMSKLTPMPILVPSARVEAQVNAAGFRHTILAKNATDEAMTQAINNYIRSNPA